MTTQRSWKWAGAVMAGAFVAVGAVAADQEAHAHPGAGTAHVELPARQIRWGEAPAALPRGAKLAVLQGDPAAVGEIVTVRLKMPKGYTIPPHFHPTDEAVTVLSGSFSMGMGDRLDRSAVKVLGPGGWSFLPAGEHHYAIANVETIVQVNMVGPFGITYLNPSDDPRATAGK